MPWCAWKRVTLHFNGLSKNKCRLLLIILLNYWIYSPLSLISVHKGLASTTWKHLFIVDELLPLLWLGGCRDQCVWANGVLPHHSQSALSQPPAACRASYLQPVQEVAQPLSFLLLLLSFSTALAERVMRRKLELVCLSLTLAAPNVWAPCLQCKEVTMSPIHHCSEGNVKVHTNKWKYC